MSLIDWNPSFGKPFSVTEGPEPGRATKRTMLEAMGGADTVKKKFQENGDGSVTMAHTRGAGTQPEFITTAPQTTEDLPIFMDSGAIEPGSTGPMSAERFNNAVLHYDTTQRLYQSMKKLLGKLWPKSMVCEPPDENIAAASFSVNADALGLRDESLLGLLYAKKLCAAFAPATMFCGKARLYAQAQYGTKLTDWKWSVDVDGTPQLTSSVSSSKLTTNSGIYLDSEFNHWLLDIDNAGVRISKLNRDKRVAPLVSLMKTMMPSDPDYEKVEAYILAYSYPQDDTSFWIDIPGTPPCDMFGYGWKFNWSGTAADIVRTEIVPITGTTVKYESTHFRISFNRDASIVATEEKSRWSAVLSTVEGPVDWKSDKWGQVIASPIWGEYTLGIFGELWGARFGDAPVYCFYKRNTLEVIRCTHTVGVSINEYSRTSTPSAWGGQQDWSTYSWYGWEGQEGTIGLDGGSGEKRARTERPTTAGFYSESVSAISTTESYTYDRSSVSQKTFNGVISATNYNMSDYNYTFNENNSIYTTGLWRDPSLTDGVPCYIGGSVQPGVATDHGYARAHTISSEISIAFTKEYYSGIHSEAANHALIIPFNDAEAAYLWSTFDVSRSEVGRYANVSDCRLSGGVFVTVFHWDSSMTNDTVDNVRIVYGGGNGAYLSVPSGAWVYDDHRSSNDSSVVCQTLITSSGNCTFTPTSSMSPFFAGEPIAEVTQQWMTGSSIEGAIYGEGARVQLGFQDFDFPPNFIGWA